jgi:fatty acid desaturase
VVLIRQLLDNLYTVTSLIYCTALLAIRRAFFGVLGLVDRVIPKFVVGMLRKWPYLSVVVTEVSCIFLTTTHAEKIFAGARFGWVARFASLAILAQAFRISASALFGNHPMSFAALREKNEAHWPERLFVPILSNPLDAVFFRMVIDISVVTVPFFVALWLPFARLWLTGALFYVAVSAAGEMLETLEHTNIHNRVFRCAKGVRGVKPLIARSFEWWATYVAVTTCARIPNWYRVQHIGVHHAEDNGSEDVQTTTSGDRRSYLYFCRSSLLWAVDVLAPIPIFVYLARHQGWKRITSLAIAMATYYAALVLVSLLVGSFWPAIALIGIAFTAGPGSVSAYYFWHAFVDPDEPDNIYRNSVDVDAMLEHGFYGAVLHLEHHLHPARHWSTYREASRLNKDKYTSEGAIVLKPRPGAPPFFYVKLLIQRRFDLLAEVVHTVGGKTEAAWIAGELERRSRPKVLERGSVSSRMDKALGQAIAATLLNYS